MIAVPKNKEVVKGVYAKRSTIMNGPIMKWRNCRSRKQDNHRYNLGGDPRFLKRKRQVEDPSTLSAKQVKSVSLKKRWSLSLPCQRDSSQAKRYVDGTNLITLNLQDVQGKTG